MDLWIATGNKGKLNEFKLLLNSLNLNIHSPAELSFFSPPPENGQTFLENAQIKTKALKAIKQDHWVIGEDSGLEVEGLGQLPGIHSARYAGPKASDQENIAKLLKMMDLRSFNNRRAQFRCVLVAYSPTGTEHITEGILRGEIAKKATGSGGFGYDPIFIPEHQDKTLSELGLAYKNKESHRAQAIRKLIPVIQEYLTDPEARL